MSLTVEPLAQALLTPQLEPGEALQWAAKPRAWSFITPPKALLGLGLLWAAFDSFYLAGAFGQSQSWGLLQGLVIRFMSLHVVPVALLLGWPLYRWLAWRNTAYGLTQKRVLLRQGVLGKASALAFDQIDGVDLRVAGQAFGVGDVTLQVVAPGKAVRFQAVADAFKVSNLARRCASSGSSSEEGKPHA